MLKPKAVALSLLAATVAATSMSAFAFGGGHDGGKQMNPQMREQMRAEMKSYRDAVMSGALTDAELAILKKEREDAMKQMQQIHERLQARTKELINNADKGAKRDKWPEDLAGMGHHKMKGEKRLPPHLQQKESTGGKDL